jgi:hypothetical protein
VLEDFFDGSDGKPVFHAKAVLAQISRKVQNPLTPRPSPGEFDPGPMAVASTAWVKWTIFAHILEFCSIPFLRDSRKRIEI